MKAGIFKTTDGTLLYVGKDQYIRASLGAKSLDGYKVVYSKPRDAVSIVAAMTNGHRVANVRNGFNRSAFDLLHDIANKVENPDVLDLHGGTLRYEAEEANDDDFSMKVDPTVNPAEAARQIAVIMADQVGVGVDHESFDKAAAALEAQAEIEQVPRKPRRVPVVAPPVRLVAQNDAAVAEQDPELAAYHGEADESDREAVNLLPDDVSPAQSLHDFVAERMHRIDTGGAAPPVFVEKPTDISADGLREILAHKEEVQQEIARKMAMPRAIEAPYGMSKAGNALWNAMSDIADGRLSGPLVIVANPDGVEEAQRLVAHYRERYPRMAEVEVEMFDRSKSPSGSASYLHYYHVPQTVFLSTPSDAKRFVEEHLQPKFEAGGVGGVGLRENEIAMPVGRLAFPLVCERQDEQLGVNLSAKGTFTAEVTLSPQMQRHFRQAVEAGRAMHEQMVNDFLTDRIELQPGVSDEVLWHNDEERERLARERLARGEFRLCHAAAARKHKKKRDRYVWWHPVFGCYAWKKIEART